MDCMYRIPLAIFFLLCFSFSSLAGEKVYTNADLKRGTSLDRNSRVDPATGKVINPKNASRAKPGPVSIVTRARRAAASLIHEMKTNKRVQAAMIGILVLIWIACLLDIVRFEFRGNNKLIWFIAVTFIPLAGWILYLFIGRRQKKYRIIRDYE